VAIELSVTGTTTPGRDVLVGLFQEPRPVFDRALEATHVYVVERFFFEGPVELAVVNLKVYIGRYPSAR
jgi:hypothetical protein